MQARDVRKIRERVEIRKEKVEDWEKV